MAILLKNNAHSAITDTLSSVETTFTVELGEGDVFPEVLVAGDEYFYLTLVDFNKNTEIVKCITRIGDDFTIERGEETTTAIGFSSGARVELRLTAAVINDKYSLGDAINDFAAKVHTHDFAATGHTHTEMTLDGGSF